MLINWLEFKGSGRRVKNIFETTTSVHTQCCWSTVSARARVWNITALNWFQNAACIARASCTRLPAPHQRSYCSGLFDVTASKEWSGRCATDRSVSQCRRGVHSEMCMFVRQCMRACVGGRIFSHWSAAGAPAPHGAFYGAGYGADLYFKRRRISHVIGQRAASLPHHLSATRRVGIITVSVS